MAEFPCLPLFTDAYLGDTTHLTTTEHGAYLLLLITQWRSNGCILPNDDKILARYTRLTAIQWTKVRPILEPFFSVTIHGWQQKRLLDEKNFCESKRNQNIAAGRVSALKRKDRHSTPVITDVPTDVVTDVVTEGQQKPNQPLSPPHPIKIDDADDSATVFKLGERIAEAVGWKDDPRWMGNYSRLTAWLAGGCDFELDILPTIKKVMAKKRGDKPKSLNYFESAIADAYATRTTPMTKGTPDATNRKSAGKNGKSERAKAAILEGLNIGTPGAGSSE